MRKLSILRQAWSLMRQPGPVQTTWRRSGITGLSMFWNLWVTAKEGNTKPPCNQQVLRPGENGFKDACSAVAYYGAVKLA